MNKDELKKMYRCTRRRPYGPGSPGHNDRSARQGYYIEAESEEQAREKMKEKFPQDAEGFDIQEWSED